ncbi:hypothetical protein J132_04143 [Termitomyces sp. J132]|nr:hypothetical protein H2248_011320 [Termitomyces sp. 'cryptogamus']KNZ72232.1 hypothetical protein J132_04143 [Termitomyces sp. J132]
MLVHFSRQASSQIPTQIASAIRQALTKNEQAISASLRTQPYSFKVTIGASPNDPVDHWAVDAFQLDARRLEQPLGTVHVYKHDYSVRAHNGIRNKSSQLYDAKVRLFLSRQAEAAIRVQQEEARRLLEAAEADYYDGAVLVAKFP